MTDIDKRLRYFNGQFLEQKDFKDEQDYHLDRQRRHNRTLHTPGVVEGLTVAGVVGAGEVTVSAGTALDDEGRQIVLSETRTLALNDVKGTTALVVISYAEVPVDPASVGNQGEMTRLEERPTVSVVAEAGAPSAGSHLRLGRLTVSAGGSLSAPVDGTVRLSAGVRLGERVTIPALRLSNSSPAEQDWPTLTANKQEIVANGNLQVMNDLTVRGKISGTLDAASIADAAVTTVKLANLGVTTAKLADLNVTTGKLADLNVTTGKIADLGVTTAKIANNAVTAAQLAANAVTGTQLAANAVTGPKITDGTINEVKLDAATRGKLGGSLANGGSINGSLTVNGFLWSQGGIFARGLLDRSVQTNLLFGPADADGAVRSVVTNFQPRLILVQGAVSFRFDLTATDSNRFGGVSNGVAVISGPTITGGGTSSSFVSRAASIGTTVPGDPLPPPPVDPPVPVFTVRQTCTGPRVLRLSTGAFANYADEYAGAVSGAFFQNNFVGPFGTTQLSITVSQVTTTGVTFRLSRVIQSGSVAPSLIPEYRLSVTVLGSFESPVDANGIPIL